MIFSLLSYAHSTTVPHAPAPECQHRGHCQLVLVWIFFDGPDGNTFPTQFLFNIFFFFKAVPVATTKSAICALMFVFKKRGLAKKTGLLRLIPARAATKHVVRNYKKNRYRFSLPVGSKRRTRVHLTEKTLLLTNIWFCSQCRANFILSPSYKYSFPISQVIFFPHLASILSPSHK